MNSHKTNFIILSAFWDIWAWILEKPIFCVFIDIPWSLICKFSKSCFLHFRRYRFMLVLHSLESRFFYKLGSNLESTTPIISLMRIKNLLAHFRNITFSWLPHHLFWVGYSGLTLFSFLMFWWSFLLSVISLFKVGTIPSEQ